MTIEQMRIVLIKRYVNLQERYPYYMMERVSLATYISANLPHMVKSDYWKAKEA